MTLYTLWDALTGEIVETGDSAIPSAPEGRSLLLGVELDAETQRVDPATGAVITVSRLPSPAELEVAINRERQRRIEAGKIFGGIAVTGRDIDRANLSDLALGATMRLATGDNSTLTTFRDGANVDHYLVPSEIVSLWQQSAAFVSALYAASWALKAMTPIPLNFADDGYWELP